jgi:hypothetical protein
MARLERLSTVAGGGRSTECGARGNRKAETAAWARWDRKANQSFGGWGSVVPLGGSVGGFGSVDPLSGLVGSLVGSVRSLTG